MRRTLQLSLAVLAALVAPSALAAPSPINTSFTVTATVARSCTVSTQNLALGEYDPLSPTPLAPVTPANISVTCNKGTAVTVAALATGARTMHSAIASDNLTYHLYKDLGHNTEWTTISTDTVIARATPVLFPVYGVVPASQDVTAANDYTDTVAVSVSF